MEEQNKRLFIGSKLYWNDAGRKMRQIQWHSSTIKLESEDHQA